MAADYGCDIDDNLEVAALVAELRKRYGLVAPQPMTVTAESFADVLDSHRMFFVGNGADKVRELISHPNAEFVCGMRLNAVDMIALSEKAFREGDFADVAYVTPAYLKQFQATTPRKNVLINK